MTSLGKGGGAVKTLEDYLAPKGELGRLLSTLARASVGVQGELSVRRGDRGEVNVYGERQTEIDVWSNDHFVEALRASGLAGAVASEEMDGVKDLGRGPLAVAMDPLDGSSNIRTNNPLGSIFGVWPRERFPGPGRDQVAAAYALYGPALTFTVATGGEVHEFIHLPREGRFVHSSGPLRLGQKRYYGMGGERPDWVPGFRKFVEMLDERRFKLRYCGCFVGDFNQILNHGGFFAYPALKSKPDGKYRLLYESAPMAYVMTVAGGAATDGEGDILDVIPKSTAQCCPTYLGDRALLQELEGLLRV